MRSAWVPVNPPRDAGATAAVGRAGVDPLNVTTPGGRAADAQVAGCLDAAATYLATEAAAVHRALVIHVPGPRGRCSGCGRVAPVWPCVIAVIARRALGLLGDRAENL